MALDAYTIEKTNEASENLAKFKEEQRQTKIELVAEVTKGTINQVTDYIVTAEDFKNNTPEDLVRQDTLVGPMVARQETLYTALMAIEDTYSEEWKTAFGAYAIFWNDREMRKNLAEFVAEKEKQIAKHLNSETSARNRADRYDVMGGGVDRATRDEALQRASSEGTKAFMLKAQLKFLEKIFAKENSPQAIKNNINGRQGICTLENKSSEVLEWEKKTGLSIVAKEYAPDDIDYKVFLNGKESKARVGNSEYYLSHNIYLINNELVFDRIDKDNNEHSLIKFVVKGNIIEKWSKLQGQEWEKSKTEFELPQKVSLVNN